MNTGEYFAGEVTEETLVRLEEAHVEGELPPRGTVVWIKWDDDRLFIEWEYLDSLGFVRSTDCIVVGVSYGDFRVLDEWFGLDGVEFHVE